MIIEGHAKPTRADRLRAIAALIRNHSEILHSSPFSPRFEDRLHNENDVPRLIERLRIDSVADVAQISGLKVSYLKRILHAVDVVTDSFAYCEADGWIVFRDHAESALLKLKDLGILL